MKLLIGCPSGLMPENYCCLLLVHHGRSLFFTQPHIFIQSHTNKVAAGTLNVASRCTLLPCHPLSQPRLTAGHQNSSGARLGSPVESLLDGIRPQDAGQHVVAMFEVHSWLGIRTKKQILWNGCEHPDGHSSCCHHK